ncbi:hypothetical protein CPHO_02190 [Corynebacterium phocae]|uniref:PTS EIIA type-1 domain-containing protein n=1 Tax=Corynebacterium phocae TaxID=161895 RepID=A0A1L7D1D9_9CORY|nr:PTS glucose transporter subunit IIA [Corynebacterium phocae]APT91914.1 hypothetical protein CPHO_02190 [Corynebacterium phocae]KAA8727370.1 PTS glucose transporter subunit IIA [Corynebacterium phocae]
MFKFGKKTSTIISPCAGNIISLDEVNDPTFSKRTVGDGFAIIPTASDVVEFCAPIAGKVTQIFNANHAVTLTSKNGLEVLIHVGLDTKHFKGNEFESLVREGQEVEAGTPLIKVAVAELVERGVDMTTPVVFPDKLHVKNILLTTHKTVAAATPMAEVIRA